MYLVQVIGHGRSLYYNNAVHSIKIYKLVRLKTDFLVQQNAEGQERPNIYGKLYYQLKPLVVFSETLEELILLEVWKDVESSQTEICQRLRLRLDSASWNRYD